VAFESMKVIALSVFKGTPFERGKERGCQKRFSFEFMTRRTSGCFHLLGEELTVLIEDAMFEHKTSGVDCEKEYQHTETAIREQEEGKRERGKEGKRERGKEGKRERGKEGKTFFAESAVNKGGDFSDLVDACIEGDVDDVSKVVFPSVFFIETGQQAIEGVSVF